MSLRDIYDCGFDEDDGRSLTNAACPECTGSLETDGGEIACLECGLIVNEYHLDHSASPRSFEDEEADPRRTGAPLTETRHDRGLSSEIGRYRDAHGNRLSLQKRRQLSRLRREHGRARYQSKRERNLGHGCTEIARMTAALSLARSLREQASALFRQAQDADLLRGRSIEAIAAASVYGVCRCSGLSRTLDEIATVARCPERDCWTAYRALNTELDLPAPPRTPLDFLPRFTATLSLPSRVEHEARRHARDAIDSGYATGCHPAGVAGACLLASANRQEHQLTQQRVASVAGVAPETIRKHQYALAAGWEAQ
jgi:transcription initiation factor TFIIB